DPRIRLDRHHYALAITPRDVADRATERRAAQRSPVEVVDALVDGLLDHALVGGEAAADAEPRRAQAGLTQGDLGAGIGHAGLRVGWFRRFSRAARDLKSGVRPT